jgi:hypothetical protein
MIYVIDLDSFKIQIPHTKLFPKHEGLNLKDQTGSTQRPFALQVAMATLRNRNAYAVFNDVGARH